MARVEHKVNSPREVKHEEDFIEHFRSQLEEADGARKESEKKVAEYFERLQRLQADMDNLQKITKRQVDSITKNASQNLLVKLLPVLDALHKAGDFAQSGNLLSPEEVSAGLRLLLKQLTDILRTEGLEEIQATGQLLNPDKHEVVSYIETDAPDNIVTEEVRKGYVVNGKVLRPSLVVVNKGKMRVDDVDDESTARE